MMLLSSLTLIFVVLSASVSAVPSRLQILAAVQNFTSDFTYPRLLDVAAGVHYEGFAPEVVGRLDITDTYTGNELLTEYIFGLFASVAKKNHTTLIGYPTNENKSLIALSVDSPLVAFSTLSYFEYKGEIGRVPVQIDSWVRYDDDLKIVQWDGVIRRFAWMHYEFEAKIAKAAAAELGITGNAAKDVKKVLQRRGTIDICEAHTNFCKGADQQYPNNAACVKYLMEQKVFGEWYQIGTDTVICRYIHHGMLEYNPKVHCPHIGPTGGGMCQDRSFAVDASAYPFKFPYANPP